MQQNLPKRVPEADVIIVNPEHYAVGLQYNHDMVAPKVIAKGVDLLAKRIREIADDNRIPIIENPPLARALYEVDLDSFIPIEHYKAVAEIISYIYKLKNKKII
jgi:flagellar biosynthetic protein FlhB